MLKNAGAAGGADGDGAAAGSERASATGRTARPGQGGAPPAQAHRQEGGNSFAKITQICRHIQFRTGCFAWYGRRRPTWPRRRIASPSSPASSCTGFDLHRANLIWIQHLISVG